MKATRKQSNKAQIQQHLGENGLEVRTVDGKMCLTTKPGDADTRSWKLMVQVKSWAAAVAAAVSLGLCSELHAVPPVAEANFADAPHLVATAPDEPVIHLTEYQKEAIADKSRIVILCWPRQAGKDFTTALAAVLDALETGETWYIVSCTQRQALATAKKAQQHAKAITGAIPDLAENEWESDSGAKTTTYGVKLPGGGEVIALPGKDPDALAGLTGNVILTEMALFPNNGVEHWRVIFPLATRGFRIWCISTPRGPDTKFSELRRNVNGKYSVHDLDICKAVQKGLKLTDETGKPITPDDLKKLYNDEAGWNREYMCIEGDDHEPLIEWKYIHDCQEDYRIDVVEIEAKSNEYSDLREILDPQNAEVLIKARQAMVGRPVLGWDIAVTGDLSVVPFGEVVGDVTWLRALLIMRGVDNFEYQEDVVSALMDLGAVGVGDASGLGREACQRVTRKYGESRFKGLVFSGGNKTELLLQYRKAIQSVRTRLPKAPAYIEYDIHSLAKVSVGVAGMLRVLTQRNPVLTRSHCDIATALALMEDAAQSARNVAYFRPQVFSSSAEEYR